MAGLINKAMNAEEVLEPAEGPGMDESAGHEGAEGEVTADSVRANMKLPAGMEAAYDKIIKAGLKMMFDPSMQEETLSFIEEANGDPAKMAEGVTAIVVTMFQHSNNTMPPNLIIPAGIELLVHAADVAKAGGQELPKEAVAQAMSEVVKQILTKFGATPEQMQKMLSGMDSGQSAPTAPAAQPAPQGA